jgi:hypothetical protein
MQPIRVAIRAADPETQSELRRELRALRGQEPPGTELLDDPSPTFRSTEALLTTMLFALAAGLSGGAGKALGEAMMKWLIERVKGIVTKKKSSAIVTVAGIDLAVHPDSDPAELAARFAEAMARTP